MRIVEIPMIALREQVVVAGFLVAVFCGAVARHSVANAQEKNAAVDVSEIPKIVLDALKGRFPKAEIRKWTQEKEENRVVYDIEFTQDGRKCEADIQENGSYINFEKAIAEKDLPEAVRKGIDTRFPKSTLKEIMEETEVSGADEKLSAYEVVVETAEKKSVELRLAPDGKILEESGT